MIEELSRRCEINKEKQVDEGQTRGCSCLSRLRNKGT
jgi:hypothetical protein